MQMPGSKGGMMMKWTKTPPSAPGWYWQYNAFTGEIEAKKITHWLLSNKYWHDLEGFLWQGPIEVPELPKGGNHDL